MTDFDDLIDREGLEPDEEARLRRVHDLLVQAGPPPELPTALEHPAAPVEAKILTFPLLPRRRSAVAAILAATLVLLAFGGGYLLGHSKSKPAVFAAERVVPMEGKTAVAFLKIGRRDAAGNWPMEMQVTGLKTHSDPRAYYELWLTRKGKPVLPCGSFRVHANTTTVWLSVPYRFSGFDGWVVTDQPPSDSAPGTVVLTT